MQKINDLKKGTTHGAFLTVTFLPYLFIGLLIQPYGLYIRGSESITTQFAGS